MSKRPLTLLIVSFTLILLLSRGVFADEAQKAWLRMYSSDGTYLMDNPDPWIEDSYVMYISPITSSISTSISVENIKADRDVYPIVVPIVTNDTSVVDTILINSTTIYPDGIWNTGTLCMTTDEGDDLGKLPPHGVYNDPAAYWIEYRSGKNLTGADTPGDSILLNLTINFNAPGPGDVKIHLDAYGWTEESGKKPVIIDDNLDASFSPFSKDIIITVPELFLPLLATTSLSLCGYLLLKRRLTKT
jgi:hypothetical protein